MALKFFYGTVNSAKSMTLLARAHAWKKTNKRVCIIKPSIDTRGDGVQSRIGISEHADIILTPADELASFSDTLRNFDLVLVDEVQFLTPSQVHELRLLSVGLLCKGVSPVDVQCYGLRTISDGRLWDSIKVLMAEADDLVEVSTVCAYCHEKAVFSKALEETDEDIKVSWGSFIPVCAYHFYHHKESTEA